MTAWGRAEAPPRRLRIVTLISVGCAGPGRAGLAQAGLLQPGAEERDAATAGPRLSLAEWLVLCLISEGPTHCFAIAGLLAHDGSLGQVWYVHKQVVYCAAQRLEQLGLITVSEKQPSRLGPDRAQVQATPEGRQAATGWLRQRLAIPGISAQNCW